MATVTGLTAERMLEIEDGSITYARLEGPDLILTTHGGLDINVGNVGGTGGGGGIGLNDYAALNTVGVGRAIFIPYGGTVPSDTPDYTIVVELSEA